MPQKHQQYTVRTLRYGPEESQEGDLFVPDGSTCPVICLLHGGFWKMPYGKDQLTAVAHDLAKRGYAVWNIEYRRVGAADGGWPGTFSDVVSAMNYLSVLKEEGAALDLNRVVVVGHSAGGHLALWSSARHKPEHFPSLHVVPIAAAGLAPISDLASTWRSDEGRNIVAGFIGGSPSEYPDRYAAASPVQLLPLGMPHAIFHGIRDNAVPIDLSRKYVEAAKASGDTIDLIELPEAGHMDFLEPASSAHAALCDWLETQIDGQCR